MRRASITSRSTAELLFPRCSPRSWSLRWWSERIVKKKKKKQEEGFAPPNLTALMDILSNIIFFLMASFGAQTLELTASAEISLPKSTSELALKKAISVAVGKKELFVEDQRVEMSKLEQMLRRVRAQQLA